MAGLRRWAHGGYRGKQQVRSVIKNFDYPWTGVALQLDLADETQLVRTDPFAFLTAVLFDHGVPAERAWLAAMLLRQPRL